MIWARIRKRLALSADSRSSSATRYQVPRKLSLASLLGVTTLFAILFGSLRGLDAPPVLFMFFGTLGFIVSIVQMVYGADPRAASIFAGGIFLPLWLIVSVVFRWTSKPPFGSLFGLSLALPCTIAAGGVLGYMTGALAAGVFLILDELEGYRRRRVEWRAGGGPPTAGPQPTAGPPPTEGASPARLSDRTEPAPALSHTSPPMIPEDTPSPESEPRVKPVGPPVSVPVFNCHIYVGRTPEGRVRARASQVPSLTADGDSEREVLQTMVREFKTFVAQYVAAEEPVPWHEPPLEREPHETERWIPVHL